MLHGEVLTAGLPIFGDLNGQGGDEPQQRGFVREEASDSRAPLDLFVEPLDGVRCPKASPVTGGQLKNSKPLVDVLFDPRSDLGLRVLVLGNNGLDDLVGIGQRRCVEPAIFMKLCLQCVRIAASRGRRPNPGVRRVCRPVAHWVRSPAKRVKAEGLHLTQLRRDSGVLEVQGHEYGGLKMAQRSSATSFLITILETWDCALRCIWHWHRCHATPGKTAASAALMPE